VALALAHGHRAGDVVGASERALSLLLGETLPVAVPEPEQRHAGPSDPHALLAAVARFDGAAIYAELVDAWTTLGPVAFLCERVSPALRAVGEAWASGALEVRHERFLSERVQDVLRTLRAPFERRAQGPLMVMAALAGERHGLGVQMAALVLAVAGWRICVLGTDVPAEEVAAAARESRAHGVAVGISVANCTANMDAQVATLRDQVPAATAVVVGGGGAVKGPEGVAVMADLDALDTWARAPRQDA
jgi:methanogenic corrinoid protein MtbC1